jgi:Right handed beta helix region/Periplasmic copper-binding protein (NosD)
MSYTLRGRLESRLAAGLLPALAVGVLALVLKEWWPLELAGLMLAVGVAFDVLLYHRLLRYQPGWLALPLGLLELGAVMGLVVALGVEAPLNAAIALFAGSWLLAQILGHGVFPLTRLTYGEDGGELGRAGPAFVASILVVAAFSGGVAWAIKPPTVHLAVGVHRGPIVIDRPQDLVGEPGAIVRGGIVVRSNNVEIRNVTVVGGQNGIEVDGAEDVVIEDVSISGFELDGINVRRSSVAVRDCRISASRPFTQGIDVSFAFDLAPTSVRGCVVKGGYEGIVSHFAHVDFQRNTVAGTALRGITVTEMSMGSVEKNLVRDSTGVGIFCGDYSECEIRRNRVVDTRPDKTSDDGTRKGYAILSHFGATATLSSNEIVRSPYAAGTFSDGRIVND